MKRFLIAVSSLSLLLPSFSFAQMGPAQGVKPMPVRPAPVRPGGGGNRPGPGMGGNRPGPGNGGPAIQPPRPNPGTRPPPRPNPGYRPPHHGHRPPHHGHRPGNSFYYGGRYRPGFHGGFYRYPPGYAYRRWSYGQTLPLLFLTSAYFFTQYAVVGLDAPPYGYQWVRYGPDLLLVQVGTGRIVDVVPGAVY